MGYCLCFYRKKIDMGGGVKRRGQKHESRRGRVREHLRDVRVSH